ncbi:F5/8 type C domain-containing protein [Chryseolinea serpens]|uniref:F5/8 type C domain-containing protein n=1 Tax=Chryseolinea serpens TaxID=947013 RepID=A0A1M5TCE2_9BACT|nr:glycosyl hydrolase [Chryseolinea serpens]SHH48361.1 F5/8 type C domain-containing protein [Chryseolinea serpens]
MKKVHLLIPFLFFQCVAIAQTDSTYLMFVSPPDAAKPRVWWHWMNGNITKDGIRKDLLWMKRTGIGGFQNFDASLMTPQVVQKRLTYMTPEWKDAFRYTTKLADSLGLEMAIAGSPGWSETGGPWVKPEDGMKKLVWTETRVKGGASNIKLERQAGITGPFQNIVKLPGFGESVEAEKLPLFYKDVAVIAFRLPAADKSLNDLKAAVTSSGGKFSLQQLTDGDLNTSILLPRDSVSGFAWIQFAFPQPQTIKAITMVGGGYAGIFGMGADPKDSRTLEASDDGVHFKSICVIPPGGVLQQTINIPVTTAKYFRVSVKNPPAQANGFAAMMGGGGPPVTPPGTRIAEVALHPIVRVQMIEEKDAFVPDAALFLKLTPPTIDVVGTSDILDLTSKLGEDGVLRWTAPSGEWKVIRFGYSLMGINNHPASPEATGLEVDKLDPEAIKRYFATYLDQYKDATGGLMGKRGLQYMVTDSWEAGAQNWTANLPGEFQKRRGYSMLQWMPVLAGNVVKSPEASEQFLFDFRKTLSDMVAEYHYDGLTKILAERGMKRYSESHENGRALIADGMEVKRTAAVPMSAIWTPNVFINQNDLTYHTADIRESASVAHIYGQNIVAAESLTALGVPAAAWSYSPEILKPTADLALAHGLNRFVIHTSVHQPVDDKIPGLGLGPFGQWFNRHDTWAEQAKAWTDYLSRSSYLLQQGKFVADVVYYYGEDNNITGLFGKKMPNIPPGYNFDFINADILVNLIAAKDKKLTTPSGMVYQVLALDENAKRMSLPVLRKLSKLVKDGVVITGPKPEATPSLSDDQNEFQKLVNEIWNSGNSNVFQNKALAEVLSSLKIGPDFAYTKASPKSNLLYVHRQLPGRDIYWVNNRTDQDENVDVEFRISGKVPELWHPETGKSEAISFSTLNGITKAKLRLSPNDAVFVVFGNNAKAAVVQTLAQEKILSTLDGNWKVSFQKDRGAPATASFDKLVSFTESDDPGIKYFSGTSIYTKSVSADKSWLNAEAQVWLDLGEVKNLAEVLINGKSMGIVWKKPFRVDISNQLKAGENTIEIRVTNLWVNRLIGDQQPGVANRITYTTMPFYQASSPLLPSGLLGPVKILSY